MLKRAAENREREKNARMRAWNGDFRRAVLKRPRREPAPTQGERAEKSQPDKGWDFTLWWRSADEGSIPISKAVRQLYVNRPLFAGIGNFGW